MNPDGGAGDILRRLAAMPLLDRLELAALSGWSRGTVYETVRRLEDAGLVAPVPHASELTAPTRRFHVTAAGLRLLAHEERLSVDELLRSLPVSAQWRRLLLARLDAVAAIYRLASALSALAFPIRLRWYRAMPADAALILPGGRTVAVVRQGRTSDRTGFAKRLWRLREGPAFSGLLLLAPDEVRLRQARRLLTGFPAPAFLALEAEAVTTPAERVWRLPSVNAAIALGAALDRMSAQDAPPAERPLARATLPPAIDTTTPGRDLPDCLLPALIKPAEKHALDVIGDWPWIAPQHLRGLLGVSQPRVSQLTTALEDFGLVLRVPAAGRRLTLSDRGLAFLARRDRTSVGVARKCWSGRPLDAGGAGEWRDVAGGRSRQLLRHLDHTAAVHAFVAALARQGDDLGWEVAQLDPPHRASRYFRHGDRPAGRGGTRSVHPDAFGLLRRGNATWPFFLEWERRAVRPTTMAARLAPYLRYYASHRPTDDHGARPDVLVVFQDEIAASHFLRVAEREMERTAVEVPLWVSHERLLQRAGPLGRAWLHIDGRTLARALPAA